jgi:AcrR family transcriptional regulator
MESSPHNDGDASGQQASGAPELRVRPIQERAYRQLERILASAAELTDEIGTENVSTAEVARRAGCSIGTVYRMFPDKHSLFEHLASRNIDVALADICSSAKGLRSAAASAVEVLLHLQQTLPGYRSLRVGAEITDMARDGWREIAKAVICTSPRPDANADTVAAALRGVDGILASGTGDGTVSEGRTATTTDLATNLLDRALAA